MLILNSNLESNYQKEKTYIFKKLYLKKKLKKKNQESSKQVHIHICGLSTQLLQHLVGLEWSGNTVKM